MFWVVLVIAVGCVAPESKGESRQPIPKKVDMKSKKVIKTDTPGSKNSKDHSRVACLVARNTYKPPEDCICNGTMVSCRSHRIPDSV
ncbi:hypothetical protein C0J52_03274 [Blattella germanica]|nr:hypothetical protein C0J52_03274 [Blattella germanica]